MIDYIEKSKREIIKRTQELIQIPSINAISKDISKPFGDNADKALKYILDLGNKLGFRTKNIDGYCGYIEFGEGKDLVGIIGHLDVVPEGEGWTFPPFSGTIFNNRIYGRGAVDDKGPVIASLFAMKSVMEKCNVSKRVRLILGLNEENDWKCIKHYKQVEESPTIGFSPDADFPAIYAEKSIIVCSLKSNYFPSNNEPILIKSIDCNNNATNVVPKFCSVELKINSKNISITELIELTKKYIDNNNFEIDIYKINENEIKLTSHGIQAHAAHPDLGINAISRLIIVINDIFKYYKITYSLFDFFVKYIGLQFDGKNLGINYKDESGNLTLNVGGLTLENNIVEINMNLRIPISISRKKINFTFYELLKNYRNISFNTIKYQPSLYISKDSYLVRTLSDIYNEMTNSNLQPITIGGATFARAFENCISFGPNFPGNEDMCHKTDEYIDINNLILACKIYAKTISKLAQ